MNPFRTAFALPALLFLLAGCDPLQKRGNVSDSPEMQAAMQAEREGDYGKAIDLYRDAIALYPKAALPNLQLAIILHDNKKDYVGAIYNYKRYIEVSARNKETASFTTVSNRIRNAEQLLAAHYVNTVSASGADATVRLMQNLEQLNKRLVEVDREKGALVAENESLKAEIRKLNAELDRKSLWIQRLQSNSAATEGGKASRPGVLNTHRVEDADGKTKIVQTYEVKKGDSLSQIAEYVYGDRSKWPRISEANPDKIQGDRVKPGDILFIPDL